MVKKLIYVAYRNVHDERFYVMLNMENGDEHIGIFKRHSYVVSSQEISIKIFLISVSFSNFWVFFSMLCSSMPIFYTRKVVFN